MLTEIHYLTVMLFHKPLLDLSHSRALLGLVSTISTSAARFVWLVATRLNIKLDEMEALSHVS